MKSIEARTKQSFLRNEFDAFGKWNIPIIHKSKLSDQNIDLIGFQDTKSNDILFIFTKPRTKTTTEIIVQIVNVLSFLCLYISGSLI